MNKKLTVEERGALIDRIQKKMEYGEITLGQAVKQLRTEITGLNQPKFALMCKISERTLLDIENDKGNPTLKSLNAVFKPFGMKMGVVSARKKPESNPVLTQVELEQFKTLLKKFPHLRMD